MKGRRDKHFTLVDQREGMYMLLVKFDFRLKFFKVGFCLLGLGDKLKGMKNHPKLDEN